MSTDHDHQRWLQQEAERLLGFGLRTPLPGRGAAWLDERGDPDTSRPVQTWITCRMVHVYALGHLMGVAGSRAVAEGALSGLVGALRDEDHGGWYPDLRPDGSVSPAKVAYDHAFVILAATSAVRAELPGAQDLLADAVAVYEDHFWDEDSRLCVNRWDSSFSRLDDYRGLNENMHSVEAFLAAYDTTGDLRWLHRAASICRFAVDRAAEQDWRLPEHYRADWTVVLEHNSDRRDDQFQPYGATVGHGFEWSRLLLHLEAALGAAGIDSADEPAGGWHRSAAALYQRARTDGWHVDGAPGFVYTTDWDGTPVVRDRLHWVVAEAIAAASALARRTGEAQCSRDYADWWAYAQTYLIDTQLGSWHHELDPQNRPSGRVWPGKPDLYHAFQATLLPRLELAPSLAAAVAHGDLVTR